MNFSVFIFVYDTVWSPSVYLFLLKLLLSALLIESKERYLLYSIKILHYFAMDSWF